MAFSLKDAKPSASYNRDKTKIGRHLCEVVNIRHHKGFHGEASHFDFKVISGPTPAGFEFSVSFMPENAQAAGRTTREQAVAKEYGKVQVTLAACYGLKAAQAAQVDDAVYWASVDQVKGASPLKGRQVVVNRVFHVSKAGKNAGKPSGFYDVLPVIEGETPYIDTEDQTPAAYKGMAEAPASAPPTIVNQPPVLAIPATPPAAVFPPAGWVVHPANPAYYYNTNDTSATPLTEADLRAKM